MVLAISDVDAGAVNVDVLLHVTGLVSVATVDDVAVKPSVIFTVIVSPLSGKLAKAPEPNSSFTAVSVYPVALDPVVNAWATSVVLRTMFPPIAAWSALLTRVSASAAPAPRRLTQPSSSTAAELRMHALRKRPRRPR